ncbi:MAG: T9SS type A sorting domain-containing protein [Bacteroidales bacterium]|nr:T9SS type A sorting domain-containing protein [Bacteroidales bacterium]
MKNSILVFLSLFTFISFSQAQSISSSVVSSLGGSGSDVTWTAGEVVINTHTSLDLVVTQGFQQTKLYEDADAIQELQDIGITIKVFPNPVENEINVSVKGLDEGKILFRLLTLKGRPLLNKQVSPGQKKISVNMEDQPAGTYTLQAIHEKKMNVYKIVKQ